MLYDQEKSPVWAETAQLDAELSGVAANDPVPVDEIGALEAVNATAFDATWGVSTTLLVAGSVADATLTPVAVTADFGLVAASAGVCVQCTRVA